MRGAIQIPEKEHRRNLKGNSSIFCMEDLCWKKDLEYTTLPEKGD